MKRKVKQSAAILIMLITAFAFTLEPSLATTKTNKVYDEVLVSGDIVYCSCELGVLRVNKKTGKKKVLMGPTDGGYRAMKKVGKKLYFIEEGPMGGILHGVNKNTGKGKATNSDKYAVEAYKVTKKKIYFKAMCQETEKTHYYKMNKKFKSVKKTSVKVKMKVKKSSRDGYKIIRKTEGDYLKCWLKTPKKKIYLGKTDEY